MANKSLASISFVLYSNQRQATSGCLSLFVCLFVRCCHSRVIVLAQVNMRYFEKTLATLLLSLVLRTSWSHAAPSETTTASAAAASVHPVLDGDGGRFFVTNYTDSSIQVSAISVIGATLIGIAIALAVGGLLPAFTGALGGAGAAGPFGKRSVPSDWEWGTDSSSWLHVLTLLDQARHLNVADADCQKKVVCELHRQRATVSGRDLGVLSDKIFDVFNYLTPPPSSRADDSGHSLLTDLLDAARMGKAKQDCDQLFSSCQFSVRKVMSTFKGSSDDADDDIAAAAAAE